MKILAGSSISDFSQQLSQALDCQLLRIASSRFSDGEINIEILDNVRGQDVYVVQSLSAPVNDNLMELLLIGDALRRASAKSITAVIPYLGYSRQDRRVRSKRVPISARVVADVIEAIQFDRVMTVDVHSDQLQGFYHIPVENVFSSPLIIADIKKHFDEENLMIVSPDVGGVQRARAIATRVQNNDLAIVDKRREKPNQIEFMQVIGDVQGRNCVLIDDMVDTGSTLCRAAQVLKDNGALQVVAYCTHPVLSADAIQKLEASSLDQIVISDSIEHQNLSSSKKLRVISLVPLLAEAISRVSSSSSLSQMYI